ncbi:hypothetical protein UA08_09404 [Talaromyces atroroseus]|uniref:ERAP1-like C-terminal domain-containing protein n=1 Tax=Talaromyces atroroseus TaxID=1441469 RepID=A0A1Q5Q663_TALAT|nr:hypothetical protein UA08_09404 [Talaromyces atroroseus]OKL55359.1 hypothetical protein UA08_09404 [Talaromyces atroroseus]
MEYWDGMGIWQIYTSENLQHGPILDGMRNSHPVQIRIRSDNEIGDIFDDISYAKGACLLQMIAADLGQEVFLQGIGAYIRKYQFRIARTEDLDKWTRCWATDAHLDAKNNLPPFSGFADHSWCRHAREATFPVANLVFFKINANHTGIYRTAYSSERLKRLGEAAVNGLLTIEDRTGLVADASSLAAVGHQRTSSIFSLFAMLNMESEYIVWSVMIDSLSAISAAWMHVPETKDALQEFKRQLIGPKAYKQGWILNKRESYDTGKLRSLLLSKFALVGDIETPKAALEMFTQYRAGDKTAIHPDLRTAAFASVVCSGSEIEYNAVLDVYRTTNDSTERIAALAALGYARNPTLVERTISMLLSNEVRLQDNQAPMSRLGSHGTGIAAVWNWITHDWPTVRERLSSGLAILPLVINLCTKGLTTEGQLRQVDNFFKDIVTRGFEMALQESLDEIKMNIRWVERDAEDVQKWLENFLGETRPLDEKGLRTEF